MRRVLVRVGAVLLSLRGALLLTTSCKPERPPCQPAELARIEAAYLAEATAACVGYTIQTCPTLPAIDQKYDAIRLEWVNCQ